MHTNTGDKNFKHRSTTLKMRLMVLPNVENRRGWIKGMSICFATVLFLITEKRLEANKECCSVVQSGLTLCNPMDCRNSRLPCPLSTPGACSNSCPLSRWCHPTISSSVIRFSSCPQSFPESWCFPKSQSLHQVAKVLELQLQHQSFQWTFNIDFL